MIRALIACVIAAGCTETVELGSGRLSGLVSLDIRPPAAIATVTDLGAPVAIDFTAIGTFVDGTRRDVSHLVEWTVDNAAPGAVFGGTYITSNAAGGRAVVRAHALVGNSAIESRADMHVIVALDLVDGVFPPPAGAETLFAPDLPRVVGGAEAPVLRYPANGTLFPQDVARVVFQLAGSPQTDTYRWRLVSESLSLAFTTGGSRWQPDGAIWSLIAATHPGAAVELELEAASSTMPGVVYVAPDATLAFSRGGAGGVLYHWSSATSSIMRSTLAAEAPTRFYVQDPDTTCVGCHAVSRDGKQMALGFDGENLRTLDMEAMTPIVTSPRPMGWATFSPKGELLVVADDGTLTLRDARTGDPVGPNLGRLPLPMNASHPDWSPDGTYVVMTMSNTVDNRNVASGSIVRVPYVNGSWGAPEVLVPGGATSNNYFPKYSPDGRFIVYVNAAGPSQGAASAELRMIRAGGSVPIPLRIASPPNLASTMPSWSPSIDGELAWLAFTSARPYGDILPAGTGQIWIAGIDLARADTGADPSFAAFWMPAQNLGVLNNNPVWAPPVQPTN